MTPPWARRAWLDMAVHLDAALRDLVDFSVLANWMDADGLPAGSLEDVSVLTGGTQNVLVRFSRGGRTTVLRRPPRQIFIEPLRITGLAIPLFP